MAHFDIPVSYFSNMEKTMRIKTDAPEDLEITHDSRDLPYVELPRVYRDYTMEELRVILEALKDLAIASEKYEFQVEPIVYSGDREFSEISHQNTLTAFLPGNTRERASASVQLLAEMVLRVELSGDHGGDFMAKFLKDHMDLFKGGGFDNHSPVILAGVWEKQLSDG